MSLIRPSTLLIAAMMAGPALYQAFVTQTMDVEDALIRYLIAVPVAVLMLAGLRLITRGHQARDQRSRDDEAEVEVLPPARSPSPE